MRHPRLSPTTTHGTPVFACCLLADHHCTYPGTPVPLLPAAGTAFTPLAVEAGLCAEYSKAWAIIGDETAIAGPVARGGLRALTSATRCALTTLPVGKENDTKATQLVQDLKAAVDIFLGAETREHKSKKKAEAEVLP